MKSSEELNPSVNSPLNISNERFSMKQKTSIQKNDKEKESKQFKEKKNLVLFIINILVICFFGFIMYKAYSPLVSLLPKKNANEQMIKTNGTNITLGGQPFHVVGVNDYDLAHKNNKEIAQTISILHKASVNTIRFWLFDDGDPSGFQPEPGVMNEARFKQADYIFYEANKYNMKVIPVLINNWTDYGGKDQYIKWINQDPAKDETIFYTDDQIKSLFEKYVSYILSRKNTYTHLTYSNDPSILGWDIMNEPRSTDQDSMNNWLISIAVFIKQRDSNHLVFAGTENATVANPKPADAGKSSNFCANSAIDICSVHLYLFNENEPLFNTYSEVTNFMQEQANYAKQLNKPILLEEFGIGNNTKPFGQDPLVMMKLLRNETDQDGYSGYLIWNWSDIPDSPLTFTPNGKNNHYSLTDLEHVIEN
jgi:mannan endo-1,4-beta-mannosidase